MNRKTYLIINLLSAGCATVGAIARVMSIPPGHNPAFLTGAFITAEILYFAGALVSFLVIFYIFKLVRSVGLTLLGRKVSSQ